MEQDLLKCCDAYCVVYSNSKLWIEVQCELIFIPKCQWKYDQLNGLILIQGFRKGFQKNVPNLDAITI